MEQLPRASVVRANNMTSLSCKGAALDACPPSYTGQKVKLLQNGSAGFAWTRLLNGLRKTQVDSVDLPTRRPARLKTRTVQDQKQEVRALLRYAFAEASFRSFRSTVKSASPGRSSTVNVPRFHFDTHLDCCGDHQIRATSCGSRCSLEFQADSDIKKS